MGKYAPIALALLASCATLADSGGGDKHLPNAAAGPFRPIETVELGQTRVGPNVLESDKRFPRDAAVVDVDGDPATLEVYGYVAETIVEPEADPDPEAPPNRITRYVALDARSFARHGQGVLEPEHDWEGGWVGAPSALRVGGQIWLYYSAAAGVGLARSDDGLSFAREPEPVLETADSGWDEGATPTSPSVLALAEGGFRMFYQLTLPLGRTVIGEASSDDGLRWERLGVGPALRPRPPSSDPAVPVWDSRSVGAPCAVLWPSAQGRTILWLYYAAVDEDGRGSIGLAARYGLDGAFQRASSVVFGASGSLDPTEPQVVRYPEFTLLFATQRAGSTPSRDYPAVAAGVAPATVSLPPPDEG